MKHQCEIPTDGRALLNALYIIQCFHPQGMRLSLTRLRTIGQQLTMTSHYSMMSLTEKCQVILTRMHAEGFIPAKGDSEYYSVENSFLFASFNGKPTIPLTLVSIFCALADECGLRARPIGFPGEVMAQVDEFHSSEENQIPLIISVFDSSVFSIFFSY
jgi:hypothetical protein